jgi:catechol 2,3-dioxygenase-like lactoylglutathione lyase family enzyme
MRLEGILEASLYCPDLDAAEAFYSNVLELELHARREQRHVFYRCGGGMLLLFNPQQTSTEVTEVDGVPIPLHGARGAGHLAFRVSLDEIDAWRQRLEAHGVAIEAEVTWPGGGGSFYFRDPAGNSLEVATPELWGI